MRSTTEIADPLLDASGPTTFWTTTNISEALPGVQTPLSWSVWGPQSEIGARRASAQIGIFPRSEVREDVPVDERFSGIFFGRTALNVDTYRRVADLTPGTSAEATELQLLGTVREGVASRSTWRRLPFVAVGVPATFLTEPRRMGRFVEQQRAWWRAEIDAVDAVPSSERAGRLRAATLRLGDALHRHCVATMVALAMYDQVEKLALRAGAPGLETRLVTGYGGLEETGIVEDLWSLSRHKISLRAVLAQHGFQGPGELRSHSWREDPAAVERLAERYRGLGDDAAPAHVIARQIGGRETAEAELLDALPKAMRAVARPVLRFAQKGIPLREAGKAAYLMAFDVARAHVRTIGRELASEHRLDDAGDVFFLTLAEVLEPPADAAAVARKRRAQHAEYELLELPRTWYGVPTPTPLRTVCSYRRHDDDNYTQFAMEGTAVCPGVVEARARVAKTLADAEDLEPGEILVCHTTDPSWASVFPLVGALAIDVGTTASHGAIVARELGIPCVINTKNGTEVLRTGDRLRVDGAKGTVECLERTP